MTEVIENFVLKPDRTQCQEHCWDSSSDGKDVVFFCIHCPSTRTYVGKGDNISPDMRVHAMKAVSAESSSYIPICGIAEYETENLESAFGFYGKPYNLRCRACDSMMSTRLKMDLLDSGRLVA